MACNLAIYCIWSSPKRSVFHTDQFNLLVSIWVCCFRLATALFQRKPSKKRKKRWEDEHRKPYIAKGVHTSWTPSPSSRAALGGARSLRASSPFGVYREKYTREWHARGDATTGDGGEKGELATRPGLERSLINLYFHPGNPGTLQNLKTVTTNVQQIRKLITACQVLNRDVFAIVPVSHQAILISIVDVASV